MKKFLKEYGIEMALVTTLVLVIAITFNSRPSPAVSATVEAP